MSDIKLFRTVGQSVTQLEGRSVALEKSLEKLIETHLDAFLEIRRRRIFVASPMCGNGSESSLAVPRAVGASKSCDGE